MFYCGTGQSLTISLAGAVSTNELPWYAVAVDTSDVVTTGSGTTNGTSSVTMIAATKGFVRSINVRNADTAAATVNINYVDNGTTRTFPFVLGVGYTLVLDSEHGWRVLDASGAVTMTSPGAGDFSGPASAVDGNFVSFDGASGKQGKDSGSKASDFATASHTHAGYVDAVSLGMYGFTSRAETSIGFNDSTYVFTLTDAGAGWSYWRNSVKYTITGNKTVTISGTPPTAATYYIYIDATDGTLTANTTPWSLTTGTKVPVAILCWNDSLTPKYCLADERHTSFFTRQQHTYEHLTFGTRIQTAGALSGYAVAPSSPADTDNDYAIAESKIWDEDIPITCAAVTGGSTYHIEYRNTPGVWEWIEQALPFKYGTYIQWDDAGTMTDCDANKYVNTYLVATNGDANARYAIIHGQAQHSSLAAAQAEKFGGLTLTGLQFQEVVAIYQVTWQTSASYSTTGKCRIAAEPVRISTSLVQAPTAPGLGTMSTQNADNVDITGGTIALSVLNINGGSADTDPDDTDVAPIYSADAAANRKVTLANLKTYFQTGVPLTSVDINGATEDTDPDDADLAAIYSGDATANRKVTLANLKTYFQTGIPTGSGFNWTTDNEVTDDQSPATTDLGERYLYTAATAASKTVTLPSVGESEDGKWLAVTNASPYPIYIAAADTDYIGWPSLKVLAIECLSNSHVVIRYDHSRTRWDIVFKSGAGQVRPKGSVLYLPGAGLADGTVFDAANRRLVTGTSAVVAAGKVNVASYDLNGSSAYLASADSADWDIFGSTSGDVTVCGWVYCDDAAGANEPLIYQYEDGNNLWGMYRTTGGALYLAYVSGGTQYIGATGGAIAQNTWHHIAMVKRGEETGVYIDGAQVGYDATFTADTIAGALYLGQFGSASGYLDGRMDDWAIVYHNIFGAAPNVGVTDTFAATLDTVNPLGLIL